MGNSTDVHLLTSPVSCAVRGPRIDARDASDVRDVDRQHQHRLRHRLDPSATRSTGRRLKRYLLETVDPSFAASVRPGDLLVAGRNFGCGSAMEVAATVIVSAGIKAVLAPSFARTFYRNAINNGLVPIECETAHIREGDRLAIQLGGPAVTVADVSSSRVDPPVIRP